MSDCYELRNQQSKFYNKSLAKRRVRMMRMIEQSKRMLFEYHDVPPFEGSLQKRSYNRLSRHSPENMTWLLKVKKLLSAYKDSLHDEASMKTFSPSRPPLTKKLPSLISTSSDRIKLFKASPLPTIKESSLQRSSANPRSAFRNKFQSSRIKSKIHEMPSLTAWEISD